MHGEVLWWCYVVEAAMQPDSIPLKLLFPNPAMTDWFYVIPR